LSLRNLLQILLELFIIRNTPGELHLIFQSRDNILIEESVDNTTTLQHTSLSSSLCTDDTHALALNAISRRAAIAKKELSSSSSGTSNYRSCDTMRTPSPQHHSSTFTPLLMSTPHLATKSRLEGVASKGGVVEEVESISSINSEVGVASTEVYTQCVVNSPNPIIRWWVLLQEIL